MFDLQKLTIKCFDRECSKDPSTICDCGSIMCMDHTYLHSQVCQIRVFQRMCKIVPDMERPYLRSQITILISLYSQAKSNLLQDMHKLLSRITSLYQTQFVRIEENIEFLRRHLEFFISSNEMNTQLKNQLLSQKDYIQSLNRENLNTTDLEELLAANLKNNCIHSSLRLNKLILPEKEIDSNLKILNNLGYNVYSHKTPISKIFISKTTAFTFSSDLICAWDLDSGTQISSLLCASDPRIQISSPVPVIKCIYPSDTSQQVLCGYDDGTICSWKYAENGSSPVPICKKNSIITCLCASSKYIIAGYRNNQVVIYSENGAQVRLLQGHNRQPVCVSISEDSLWLATGAWDSIVLIWDLLTFTHRKVELHNYSRDLAIISRLQILVVYDDNEKISIWDMQTGSLKISIPDIAKGIFVPGNSSQFYALSGRYSVEKWDFSGNMVMEVVKYCEISCFSLTVDGKYGIAAMQDGEVWLMDLPNSRHRSIGGHLCDISCIDVGEQFFVTGSANGLIIVWSIANRNRVASFECEFFITEIKIDDISRTVTAKSDEDSIFMNFTF